MVDAVTSDSFTHYMPKTKTSVLVISKILIKFARTHSDRSMRAHTHTCTNTHRYLVPDERRNWHKKKKKKRYD